MPEPGAVVFYKSPVVNGELRVESDRFSTIEVLPEEVILEIFHFHKLPYERGGCQVTPSGWQGRWHKLAHVCRRWRTITFASQHRLGLQLLCTSKTSIKQTLDIWPDFPILVRDHACFLDNWDNIIDALQQRDRVCEIDLAGPPSGGVSQILQGPFPLLDRLALGVWDSRCPAILSGPAPRLRVLELDFCPSHSTISRLPRILSSATRLVDLQLGRVPSTKCISPEALVAALSAMTRLKTLYLQFLYPTPHSIPVNIPPSGRIVSSTLLRLDFYGPCNYFEDLLSRITTPSLECMRIKFDSELPETRIDISQLSQFLYRVESQRLPDGAKVSDGISGPYLSFTRSVALPGGRLKTSECLRFGHHAWLRLKLPLMTQICQQMSPFLPSVQTLSVPMLSRSWHDDGQGTYWVDFFRVFNRLEKLHLSGGDPSSVVHALQFVSTVMATDALPVLRELSLDSVVYGPSSRKAVASFLDVHQRAGLPAITFRWLNSGPF
ncbi:hypothetical protein EDB89DRAFT_2239155 [Lactarius sanguifluus]|nr:hypothetical protein EDB89DRAFT_2239155 [Lactarius sanguifluus]